LDYQNYRVILVDNCSEDGTEAYIKSYYPEVEYVRSSTNLGYAAGNNLGIKHALMGKSEYIFVLNNDTEIAPDCLRKLVDILQDDSSVGVVGATIYYHCKPDCIWFNGARLNDRTGDMEAYSFKEIDKGQFDRLLESDYAPGCGMLVRSSAIRKCGGIDSRFFIYFEESDWCLQIKRLGYRILIHPKAKVWHKISMAFGKETPTFLYYTVRNNLLFIKKNVPLKSRCYAYIRCLKKYCIQLRWMLGEQDRQKWAKARAICTGILDFLMRRFGRGSARFLLSNAK
jgi:GT2 family glycosyltransferase